MEQLQYRMYAENKHSLLIVLQGLDAAGKDGVVRHVLTGMNPSGCVSTNFKRPTQRRASTRFSLASTSACASQRLDRNF